MYYQHDQYGSTRLLTNQAGAVTASYTYNAYGALTTHTGTADTPLRWNGQYQDTDTGLYYLRTRYYNPATAQFLTRDPLEAQTLSSYGYVGGDPLNFSDPTGLCGHWYDLACQVGDHWRGIAQTAVIVGAVVATTACVASVICGVGVAATIAGTAAIGAGAGAAVYGLGAGSHTAEGYASSALWGAAAGVAGAACLTAAVGICASELGQAWAGVGIGGATGLGSYLTTTDSCDYSWKGAFDATVLGGAGGLSLPLFP